MKLQVDCERALRPCGGFSWLTGLRIIAHSEIGTSLTGQLHGNDDKHSAAYFRSRITTDGRCLTEKVGLFRSAAVAHACGSCLPHHHASPARATATRVWAPTDLRTFRETACDSLRTSERRLMLRNDSWPNSLFPNGRSSQREPYYPLNHEQGTRAVL